MKIKRMIALMMTTTCLISSIPVSAQELNENQLNIDNSIDYSSCSIIVSNDIDILDTNTITSQFEDLYVLSFASIDETKQAYEYYKQNASICDINTKLSINDESMKDIEDNSKEEITEESNDSNSNNKIETEENSSDSKDSTEEESLVEENIPESILSIENNIECNGSIAVIDTGINKEERVVERASVIGESFDDDNGHGTTMYNNIVSKNPDAKILSIKALDNKGIGLISDVYRAIRFAIDKNVSIINISMNAYKTDEAECINQIIQEAYDKGIYVVVSAGNDNRDTKYYVPASNQQAFVIGSCDDENNKQSFSNYGDSVDYYLVSNSTSEAASLFTGILSKAINEDKTNELFEKYKENKYINPDSVIDSQDLEHIDWKNLDDESLTDVINENSNLNLVTWIESLNDEDISLLLKKDTPLIYPYYINTYNKESNEIEDSETYESYYKYLCENKEFIKKTFKVNTNTSKTISITGNGKTSKVKITLYDFSMGSFSSYQSAISGTNNHSIKVQSKKNNADSDYKNFVFSYVQPRCYEANLQYKDTNNNWNDYDGFIDFNALSFNKTKSKISVSANHSGTKTVNVYMITDTLLANATERIKLSESHSSISSNNGYAATCTAAGKNSDTKCSGCGKLLSTGATIPALGHSWVSQNNGYAATCTTAGKNTDYKCSRCGVTSYGTAIAALGHSYSTIASVDKVATCTENGQTSFHCTRAGCTSKSNITIIPALGHSWNEGVITKEATCTEKGLKTHTCTKDNTHTYTEEIPASGHDWKALDGKTYSDTNTGIYECTKCKVQKRSSAGLDINSIINGTTYGNGKDGFTFNIEITDPYDSSNNTKYNATNYTDYCHHVEANELKYGMQYKITPNTVKGYTATQKEYTGTLINSSSDTHVTPEWNANTYVIVYNGNNATNGTTNQSSHTYDVIKNLTKNGYSRTGFTFVGWNTKADGSGTSYKDEQSVLNLTDVNNGKITLYAQWKLMPITVSAPKTIVLDSKGNASFKVSSPDIQTGNLSIKTTSFVLKQDGKSEIIATASTNNEKITVNKKTAIINVSAPNISAGTWKGTMLVTLNFSL